MENTNKIVTFSYQKPAKNKNIGPHQKFAGSHKKFLYNEFQMP